MIHNASVAEFRQEHCAEVNYMLKRVFTIGVYGWTPESFFEALQSHRVEVVVDVRQRRLMRGSLYRFANARALQQGLLRLGIDYVHLKQLAPTDEVRLVQKQADAGRGIRKRERTCLSAEFIQAYSQCILSRFSEEAFLQLFPEQAKAMAILCVERDPEACHRSLISECLSQMLRVEIVHLRP